MTHPIRPKGSKDIHLRLPPEMVSWLDENFRQTNRSQAVRNILAKHIREVENARGESLSAFAKHSQDINL